MLSNWSFGTKESLTRFAYDRVQVVWLWSMVKFIHGDQFSSILGGAQSILFYSDYLSQIAFDGDLSKNRFDGHFIDFVRTELVSVSVYQGIRWILVID